MNYLKVYNALMEKRKLNPPKEDFERHHILPKSLFPEKAKDRDNLVKLQYREHYIAHHLLYRYYESIGDKNGMHKMAFAWRRMCKNTNGLHISLNMYEKAKKCDIEIRKQLFKGEGNPFYGKHLSEESKRKMSKALKGKTSWNKGITPSAKTRQKLRISHLGIESPNKGRIWINNGKINKMVFIDQIPDGFKRGMLKNINNL